MGGKEGRREGGRKGGREEGRQAGRSREKDLCCQENEHTFHLASVSPSLPPLPPIPPGCFYVTEADGTGLALHFFRKPVWDRVQVEREGGRDGRTEGVTDSKGNLALRVSQLSVTRAHQVCLPFLPSSLPLSLPPPLQSTPLEVLFPGQYEPVDLSPPSAGQGRGEGGKEEGGERAPLPWRLGVSAVRLMPKKKVREGMRERGREEGRERRR